MKKLVCVLMTLFLLSTICSAAGTNNQTLGVTFTAESKNNTENQKARVIKAEKELENRIRVLSKGVDISDSENPYDDMENKEFGFYDDNGKLLKKIDFKSRRENIMISDGKEYKGIRRHRKLGKLSTNGKFALTADKWKDVKGTNATNEVIDKSYADLEGSKVSLYNERGKMLWEKKMEANRSPESISDLQTSENGYSAVMTYENFSLQENPKPKITVFSPLGEKILIIPEEKAIQFEPVDFYLSPTGKYISVGLTNANTIIYNLKTKKNRNIGEFVVNRIDDEKDTALIFSGLVRNEIKLDNLGE